MPNTIAFDTLAYTKKLKAAGVPENQAEVQAEALAEIVQSRLATKQDVIDIRKDIKELESKELSACPYFPLSVRLLLSKKWNVFWTENSNLKNLDPKSKISKVPPELP